MMGIDEAGTLTALKAWQRDIVQPLMTKHYGRVVKLMGDAVLQSSPVPLMPSSVP